MIAKTCILTLLLALCNCDDNRPVVKTPLGTVKGYFKTSHGGRKFAAFEGIPYAEPPIGNGRFEDPKPIQPWTGTWNATYLTACPQTNMMEVDKVQGDEDCLHINVYTPRENPNPEENLDVIVHIHGGAYMYGAGNIPPDFIMDHDVIFVSFNYRLGILGFLSTEDDVVSGNSGLKDQVMALRWIQDNIASFGGNPGSVTLTGLSAGGSSVHLHYFSEMSKGLFHRGFSQSGVALNSFSLQKEALSKARRLGEAVGCPSSPSRVLVDCLKQRPYKQLLDKTSLFFGYQILPLAPFGPVVEKGSRAFLDKHPYYLLTKGRVLDVPWLASHADHEGMVPVIFLTKDIDNIYKNWDSLAPILLDFNDTLPQKLWKGVAKNIKDFYIGEAQDFGPQNMDKFVKIFSDRIFLVDGETAVRQQAKASRAPVYYYFFTYLGDNNEQKMVGHGGDAKYFYGNMFNMLAPEPLTQNEIKMKDFMVDMLVAYAKTGIPVINEVEFKPTKDDELTFTKVSGIGPGEISIETIDELSPRQFWRSLGIAENENLIVFKDEL